MRTSIWILFFSVYVAFAQSTIYVPSRPGNAGNNFPFGNGVVPGGDMRYQQVYDATAFSSVAPSGGWVTALTFHFDNQGQIGGTISNAAISFSTTLRAVDSLSPVFAQNVGLDDRIVIGPGSFRFVIDPNSPPGTVKLPFDTPFFYTPAAGNLLMDVRMTRSFDPFPISDARLEASTSGSDLTSRVWAFGVNSLSGTADSIGLVTGFTFTPIPEPSMAVLTITSLLLFSLFGFRKYQPNRKE